MIGIKRFIGIFIVGFGLISCHPEGRIYVEHEKLSPDVEWLKDDNKEFKVPIEDNSLDFKMSLSFRYANGYQFQVAKVKVKEVSPSGKEQTYNYSLKVREDDGNYIGDAGYDIWDSEHVVEPIKKYKEKGVYTYTIEHDMPDDPLNFAMEIGIILDKK